MILVDDREKVPSALSVASTLMSKGIQATVTRLDAGDFSFQDAEGGLVLVTRKAKDLFRSVYDGHLKDELSRCVGAVQQYGKGSVWFMLDGVYVSSHTGIGVYTTHNGRALLAEEMPTSPRLIEALGASMWAAGVGFITTTYVPGALETLWKRSREVKDGRWPTTVARGVARPELKWHASDSKVARLMSLWPRLNERIAATLIAQFGSVGAIVDVARTEPERLRAVPGVGQKTVQNFVEVIT